MTNTGYATMSVASILAETAKRMPENVALIFGEQKITYAELWDQTLAYAGALRARGIGPGDAVALLVPNVPDFPRAYYAILSLGAVVVPVHALLKADEIAYVLRDSGSRLLICAAPLLGEGAKGAAIAGIETLSVLVPDEMLAQAPFARLEDEARAADPIDSYVPRNPFDTATILYTSGTTGKPKGAEGCHFSLVEQVNTLSGDAFDVTPEDRILGCLPLFHTFGQTCVMNLGFRIGSAIVLVPKFDGATALSLLNAHQCTIMTGVPTMYIALLEAAKSNPERPPLRYGMSGGAAIPVAVIERMKEVYGIDIHEGYGLTETSPVATFNHRGRPTRVGTVGQPIWGVDVEIADAEIDDRIELLPRGELGEIIVRGHNLMKGYLHLPEANAEAVVDGWFRTGDLGTKSDDDYVTIVDRKKDMIVRNGYNVYPREVEEVLSTHPAVAMVAVFGVSDATRGQEIVAAVTLMPGQTVDPSDLVAFAQEQVAAYKYPRRVEILEVLPLGPSGKVLKRELVARFDTA
ncbi:long-chain fatty acid--CoA ligase [Diaminobutyricibacter tongyongensis]|uniref:Long-chain fatty acid--CoA ligase n=1 Tax=Leifsonia tongyongensis TaxID=1268043 RepID=A0A6L9Y0F1_9MICO|nr:long-chain fatty acid--CoA ligase [Diaminobutyricibacter tongyongensis]NEN07120.1 long-chain fatty acid--CoA ligase [Diaminobutyricibacter tongyongensis]